ncbi:hypothetical protein CFOL_v3_07287 [Cephalotus follicularis]|uniref:Uncharacterized protein n=1 Tax=Cephalotus follicularis TaxID=3775 RepID=A0A1Q3B771_CEPFO|nr:hypothetical protein CFOL_v3_07287 [Cephalotus follicularis]
MMRSASLHQCLILWNGGNVEVVQVDGGSFVASSNAVKARYYGG